MIYIYNRYTYLEPGRTFMRPTLYSLKRVLTDKDTVEEEWNWNFFSPFTEKCKDWHLRS